MGAMSDQLLVPESIELVSQWLDRGPEVETDDDRATTAPLQALIEDPDGVGFAMRFIDRVIRPEDDRVAAAQLASLVGAGELPGFLSALDRLLLRAGALLGPSLPKVVMPLARRRMRQLVGHLVVDSEPKRLAQHLQASRADGFAQNVNLLGEAVMGRNEAGRRLADTLALIDNPDIDYVSVKLSSVVPQLNHWDWDGSRARVVERLTEIMDRAAATGTFVNLDMEEYLDLDLTIAAFIEVLSQPERAPVEAGIVLQAYLPDSFLALQHLTDWATETDHEIKIRLVKGANLAMEKVEAELHGWPQAPYETKAEVDANYKRCLDWVLTPERTARIRIGVGSHNLFDVAWAHLLSAERGVADRIQFEMLQGMAPTMARVVRGSSDRKPLLLYTPIVANDQFDVAIAYLFRRLEENAAPENFIRSLFSIRTDASAFAHHADAFADSVAKRWSMADRPRRTQVRPAERAAATLGAPTDDFVNEPDSDPSIAANRKWAVSVLTTDPGPANTPLSTTTAAVDAVLARCRAAEPSPPAERVDLLRRAADVLARRRGELIAVMAHEAGKTFQQADAEVSEAIDFARYYSHRIEALDDPMARFEPLGTVAVIPPWNFPVAIPCGGALAAVAAGNQVVLKPAPETPRCGELLVECLAEAGIDAVHYLRTPDDEVGRHLVRTVDGVILTGSFETARRFRSWHPGLKLLAETSGKNAMVITPQADIDLAVKDLVASAFTHAGQKCSAASLAICVGDVSRSPRFLRQLTDAVEGLNTGPAVAIASDVGPLIGPPTEKLARALQEPDARWLVAPRRLSDDGHLWSPGVRFVEPGSWFHLTECFGPVLGIMAADDLDQAIAFQNATDFGLTGGIHSLDPAEIEHWLERVEVGNAYVNKPTTGAIVGRQPFGGWKRSSVGPGAKAGGPNYVDQLGTWHPTEPVTAATLEQARVDDRRWWRDEYGTVRDPSGLRYEANVFRYRSRGRIGLRVGVGIDEAEVERVRHAASVAGCLLIESRADSEPDRRYARSIRSLGVERIRHLGPVPGLVRTAAGDANVDLADDPVTLSGRLELRHYLREQVVSMTGHRFGNLLADPVTVAGLATPGA